MSLERRQKRSQSPLRQSQVGSRRRIYTGSRGPTVRQSTGRSDSPLRRPQAGSRCQIHSGSQETPPPERVTVRGGISRRDIHGIYQRRVHTASLRRIDLESLHQIHRDINPHHYNRAILSNPSLPTTPPKGQSKHPTHPPPQPGRSQHGRP